MVILYETLFNKGGGQGEAAVFHSFDWVNSELAANEFRLTDVLGLENEGLVAAPLVRVTSCLGLRFPAADSQTVVSYETLYRLMR